MDLFDAITRTGGRMLRLLPLPKVMKIPMGINRGLKWVRNSANVWEWLGIYESEKQQWVLQLTKPGMSVIDIGANAGFYTLAFSRLVGSGGKVFALEPLGSNTEKLLTHIRLNRITNTRVIQAVAADRSGVVPFEKGADDFTGRITKDANIQHRVPAVTLDDLFSSGAVSEADLLKIDVEGGEYNVLKGARALLRQWSPSILLALHGSEQKQRCRTLLSEHGYSLFDLRGNRIPPDVTLPDEIYAVVESTG